MVRAVRAVDGPAASGDAMELEEYLAISRDYEARLDLSKVVIELLSKSYDLFRVPQRRRTAAAMATRGRLAHASLRTAYAARACSQKYKNLRMSLYMASLIAQEFIASGDHATAYTYVRRRRSRRTAVSSLTDPLDEAARSGGYAPLRYCTKIAKNYRKERWSAILADVLDMSLQCARKLERTDDEIALSLEFISEGAPRGRRCVGRRRRHAHAAARAGRGAWAWLLQRSRRRQTTGKRSSERPWT